MNPNNHKYLPLVRTGLIFYLLLGWLGGLATFTMSAYGMDLSPWAGRVALAYLAVLLVLFLAAILPRQGLETPLIFNWLPASRDFSVWLAVKPWWAIVAALAGFALLPVTLNDFYANSGGIPEIKDGQYVLTNHGALVRMLTAEEYHRRLAVSVLFFSLFWITLMGFAIAIVAPDRPSTRRSSSAV